MELQTPLAHTDEKIYTLRRVSVANLFGNETYSYDLRKTNRVRNNLIIFYGDNGCGKTTLLNLIFYLLASTSGRGFKGVIAKTPFTQLIVDLGHGVQISAEKDRERLVGSFTMRLQDPTGTIAEVYCKVDGDGDITPKTLGYFNEFEFFLDSVAKLKLDIFFISDDRRLLSSSLLNEPHSSDLRFYIPGDTRGHAFREREEGKKPIDDALESALTRANQRIRQQILFGSQQGEMDANSMYSDIIRALLASDRKSKTPSSNIQNILIILREQAIRSMEFSRLGLPSPTNLDDLIKLVETSGRKSGAVLTVLEPYIASLTAKLDALQQVRDTISNLLGALNSFFTDKIATFDVTAGMLFTSTISGKLLSASVLSSGEKQLILLFCNTLVAKGRSALFIIDEPELSLNIKWQRKLVGSLLKLTRNESVQFLMATHSFQILAEYDNYVIELKPKGGTAKTHEASTKTDRIDIDIQA